MKLGVNATAHLNTGTWESPTWSELGFIRDLTENITWTQAEIIKRGRKVRYGAKTTVDIGISANMYRESDNADYLTLLKLNGGWKVVSKTYRTDVRE